MLTVGSSTPSWQVSYTCTACTGHTSKQSNSAMIVLTNEIVSLWCQYSTSTTCTFMLTNTSNGNCVNEYETNVGGSNSHTTAQYIHMEYNSGYLYVASYFPYELV